MRPSVACLVFLIGSLFQVSVLSCKPPSRCRSREQSNTEVRHKVEQYFKARGENLPTDRKAQVSVKREACDYLYIEMGLPPAPGDHFVVRLNEKGQIAKVYRGR